MAMLAVFASAGWAAAPGDVTGEGTIEMDDAIMALQIAAGIRNGEAGLYEAVTALKVLVGIPVGQGRAVLGPLAGAEVNVYRLNDLNRESRD